MGRARGRRLGMITQWYPPESAVMPSWIAEQLAHTGWRVRVLTGIPNYPTGQVAPGYRAWRPGREHINSIPVYRAPLYPSHDRSIIGRIINYVSWAASAGLIGLRALARADVNLVYSSPATAAWPAMVRKVVFGTPFVLQIQDLWPDSITESGFVDKGAVGRLIERAMHVFCNLAYAMSAHVVVISPGMAELLAGRGVPREKITLVYNWIDEELFTPASAAQRAAGRAELGLADDEFTLMYAGNLGAAQGLDAFVRAVSGLPAEVRCRLVLVGDGVERERLVELAAADASGRVTVLPPRPIDAMPQTLAAADMQIVSLVDRPLFRVTMPSKVQTILACGLPVLVSVAGDAAEVVTEAKAGISVAPGDAEALQQAIMAASSLDADELNQMGRNGLACYRTTMSAGIGRQRLDHVLGNAAKDGNERTASN